MKDCRNRCYCTQQYAEGRVKPCRRDAEIKTECPVVVDTPVMAYVPWQNWGDLYSEPQALSRGTLFAALDKPFCGKGGYCCG